eukprot:COSAG02_NODE_369_length_23680_cov_36.650609_14_plen_159_part_00
MGRPDLGADSQRWWSPGRCTPDSQQQRRGPAVMSTCRKCTLSRTRNHAHGKRWTLPHRYPRSSVHRQFPTSAQQGCTPPCDPGGSSLAFAGQHSSTACERSSASSVVDQQTGELRGLCQPDYQLVNRSLPKLEPSTDQVGPNLCTPHLGATACVHTQS